VYHLTRYRYIFFLLSGLVIVPGLLALIFWHLNLGIDFTNGTTVDLRFADKNVTTVQLQQAFQKVGAQDVNVLSSTDYKSNVPPSYYAYIEFSRPIGDNLTDKTNGEVIKRMQALDPSKTDSNGNTTPGAQVIYTLQTLAVPGKPDAGLMVVLFDKAVAQSAITDALKNLPATQAPTSVIPGASSTPAASATTTTTPAPTATPAKATPTATTTPAAGASTGGSTSSTTPTFPVTVTNAQLGQNGNMYEVETQTTLDGRKAPTPETIALSLYKDFGPVYVVQKDEVGPAIAGDTARNAILAVLAAAIAIMIYIAIAFRKVGSYRLSLRFGASAIIALLHDAFVVLGLWAIFGHLFDYKVDTLFLTAVLTVIGFSVHDTIVVFDRIRENLGRRTSESFGTVVDTSLIQTMSRSLNTSLTVLFTLSAEVLFGGASIHDFVLALLIGIASGTYSSIFNASMILYVWETGEFRTWFRRGGRKPRRAPVVPSRDLVGSRA
jgi:preprotein translocase SecF subunit